MKSLSWVALFLLSAGCSPRLPQARPAGAPRLAPAPIPKKKQVNDTASVASEDPYLWLEEIRGRRALAWVRERNQESSNELVKAAGFADLEAEVLEIMDSRARIPFAGKRGQF